MRSLFFYPIFDVFCNPSMSKETTTTTKPKGGTTNRKHGVIEVYDEQNTIVQYYVKTRLYVTEKDDDEHGSFNVEGLLKYKSTLNKEEAVNGIVTKEEIQSFIGQYIERENKKAEDLKQSIDVMKGKKKTKKKPENKERIAIKIKKAKQRLSLCPLWLDFYRYLKKNWRLFVLLDLLYPLLDGRIAGIKFIRSIGRTTVGTHGTFPDSKKTITNEYPGAKKDLHTSVTEIYNDGLIRDKKNNVTFKEPRFRVYSVLFDVNTGDTVFSSIKNLESKDVGGFYAALVAINKKIKDLGMDDVPVSPQPQPQQPQEGDSIVVDEPVIVTPMVSVKSRKSIGNKSTETGEIVGKVQTIGSTKRQIAFHPHLVVFLSQVARTNEGYESLPYMVEYIDKIGVSNKNLIKLLSICAHQRSIDLIVDDEGDDNNLDENYQGIMPLLSPYRSIVNGITSPSRGSSPYIDLFISSVLRPQFYVQFWTRVIHRIQSSLMGIDNGVITGTRMVIPRKTVNRIHKKLVDINEYLETAGGLVYVGYERIMIESIMNSFFIVVDDDDDDGDDDMVSLIMMLSLSEWSYDEIKTSCINRAIEAINVGSTLIYSEKTSGALAKRMTELVEAVRIETIKAEIETACFNLTETDALVSRPIRYIHIDTNCSLSPCDLLVHYMRLSKTPKERARVSRLLNLFASRSVDGDIRSLYASIQSILVDHPTRVRYRQLNDGRYTDLDNAKYIIESNIEVGPRLVYDDETGMHNLTRVKSYRIITDHMSGHGIQTVLIFRDIYEWPVMSDDLSSDMDAMFRDGRVHCIVEHRKNDRTTKLRKIALSRMTSIDHAKLETAKLPVINQALGLSMGSILRCDIVLYQEETWFIIVSGTNDGTRNVSSKPRRVISLIENYERLSKRVQPMILDGDDIRPDNTGDEPRSDEDDDIVPDRERWMDDDEEYRRDSDRGNSNTIMYDETRNEPRSDDDDIIPDRERWMDDDEYRRDSDRGNSNTIMYDEPLSDIEQKSAYISSKFSQLRSLVYMSQLNLRVLIDGRLVVPLVHRKSRFVVMTRLINVEPGLFGGTLSLQGITTDDQTIVQVSVEKLIFDMSAEISLNMTMQEIRRLFGEED